MVHLRELQQKDAPLMLEWMHDEEVVHFMKADFLHKTLSDCEKFIESAQVDSNNVHLAATDDNDTYMGTVSLKNIDNDSAEFAITMRRAAMGKGYAAEAMKQIIDKVFSELGLEYIYWYVRPENKRAVRFYDKNGYQRMSFNKLCDQLNKTELFRNSGGGTRRSRILHLVPRAGQQSKNRVERSNTRRQLNMRSLSALVQKNTEEKDD